MDQNTYIERLDTLKKEISEYSTLIDYIKKSNEVQMELAQTKLQSLMDTVNSLESEYKCVSIENKTKDIDNEITYEKISEQQTLESDEIISGNQSNKSFKVTSAFSPVKTWVDSFKKTDKWKKALRWLLPNALRGVALQDSDEILDESEKMGRSL